MASLPSTREQAWQAAKNREQVARVALTSAKEVNGYLKTGKSKSISVDMGKSKDGKSLTGKVERVIGDSGLLRVKMLKDNKPEASFVYAGNMFQRHGGEPSITLREEIPSAEGPDVHAIAADGRSVVSLALGRGLTDHIYTGSDTVTDRGAMNFLAVTQVLATAAEQIRTEQPAQAA